MTAVRHPKADAGFQRRLQLIDYKEAYFYLSIGATVWVEQRQYSPGIFSEMSPSWMRTDNGVRDVEAFNDGDGYAIESEDGVLCDTDK